MARIKGELAFAEGRLGDAIAALELAQVSDKTAFQITLSLAEAWEARGDDAKAVQLLEDASRYRIQSLAYRFAGGYKWLQVRARLAVLYRKIGRIRDADVIENELRQLLVVADDEHPIQRRLQVRAR
jgi:tetratricopeptide (TPR) repeat protein